MVRRWTEQHTGCGGIHALGRIPELLHALDRIPELLHALDRIPELLHALDRIPEILLTTTPFTETGFYTEDKMQERRLTSPPLDLKPDHKLEPSAF